MRSSLPVVNWYGIAAKCSLMSSQKNDPRTSATLPKRVSPRSSCGGRCQTSEMDLVGMGEGDRVIGVRVAHGWDADTSTPLVLLQLRTDAGQVGLVSLSSDLAQLLVDQIGTAIEIARSDTD